jgi:hypothetical protein
MLSEMFNPFLGNDKVSASMDLVGYKSSSLLFLTHPHLLRDKARVNAKELGSWSQ